jgi:predicted tellurium resistance membrane protein TerC
MNMNWISDPTIWLSLITLTILEIVLGIDNIVFLSITTSKLPKHQQKKGRQIGLGLAMITRVLLLLSITWVMRLTQPLFSIASMLNVTDPKWLENLSFSGRDLILLIGGLFLIYKSTKEIHEKISDEETKHKKHKPMSFAATIVNILILDVIFSLDSVITAVGMANHVGVMIAAVVIAVCIMLWASESISNFVSKHKTVKTLALMFLMVIGVSLLAEGFNQEIPKGYIYFAMAFSLVVEMLNLREKNVKEQ